MSDDSLFDAPLLPVASEDDAVATCDAALPHLERAGGRAVVVHVIEKAGGAPDKASVEQREALADDVFEVVEERFVAAGVPVETRLAFGTDVAETIVETAADVDATAIVFTPRGGSRWAKLLSGDVAYSLVEGSDRPVVVLPDEEA